jgi:spore coat-associated protein N
MQRVSALWQASPRKLAGALFVLMLAAMMAVASGASFTSTSANVGNVVTAGDMTHENTASGVNNTILTVTDLMPGDTKSGFVTLKNTGDAAGALTVKKSALVDSNTALPFSNKLELTVTDITGPSDVEIWSGTLSSMPTLDLDSVAIGAQRDYRFDVHFPDGGKPLTATSGDNRYKNASTTVDYNWELVSE